MADDATREDLVYQVKAEQQKAVRAPRVHRAPASASGGTGQSGRHETAETMSDAKLSVAPGAPDDEFNDVAGIVGADAPKKRRRRRRKPTGAGDAGGGAAPAGQ